MAFKTSDGQTLSELYFTEAEWLDRFVGNTLWACGYNLDGQLGDGTSGGGSYKSVLVQDISKDVTWRSCATGTYGSAAIRTDGTLWLWGPNYGGNLGDGTTINASSPVQTISGGTNWKQVAVGGFHVAAVKTDGSLWTWGRNTEGQLGDGTVTATSSPIQTIAGGNDWKFVACGYYSTAAIKTDGSLWMWGWDNYGQLGDGTVVNKSSPVQTIAGGTDWYRVACGYTHTIATKSDGTAWGWGLNNYGQLGDGTTTTTSSPVQVIGSDWKQPSAGYWHSAIVKNSGSLWSCGYNGSGEAGNGTIVHNSSPVQTIAGGTDWKQVTCGTWNTGAVKTDGSMWLWGYDAYGQLGDGTTVSKSSPVQTTASGYNWKQVSMGQHTLAITFTDY